MEDPIDIELLKFGRHKFQVFIEACKKNAISPRDVIDSFMDDYIVETFGVEASSVEINVEETIEEY
jgi:hypothetical protein